MRRRTILGAAAAVAAGGLGWLGWTRLSGAGTLDDAAMDALFARPLPLPAGPMRVYHLGHSLVGRDMPRMLGALADAALGPGHGWDSQLGWGASLRDHWGGRATINGFDVENAHPRHRPAEAALASGDYDAVVFTEMVELRDALRWHDSPEYLARWARRARAGRADVRLYLYTTWHRLDDPAGFLERIDADQAALWEGALLRPALARVPGTAIHVIPGGPALAAVVRAAEGAGGLPGLPDRTALFRREADGRQDVIHLSALGLYVIALTHFAVLYHRDVRGLPFPGLDTEDGPADPPPPETLAAVQGAVQAAVQAARLTGL